MNSSIGNKVILDSILQKMQMINTDIVPGSRKQKVLSSTENVPVMIRSEGDAYATYELCPSGAYVLDVENSYIHNVMHFKYYGTIKNACAGYIAPLVSSNSDFAKALDLMLNNSSILQTTLNRVESSICTASLSNDVVNGLPDKTNLEEVLKFKSETAKYINCSAFNPGVKTTIQYDYDYKIPLETLSLALSHMLYIVSDMGRLRLKIRYSDIKRAFKFVYIPPMIATNTTNAGIDLIELMPIRWGVEQPITTMPPTGAELDTGNSIKFECNDIEFMTCSRSDMVQETFDISPQSVAELRAYAAQQGCWILPCEHMITQPIDQTYIASGNATDITAQIAASNIKDLIVTYIPDFSEVCLMNPYFKSMQLTINGRTVNDLPYTLLDSRAYSDFINAVIDDDKAEPNGDFKYSLRGPYDTFLTSGSENRLTYHGGSVSLLSGENLRFKDGYLLMPNMAMLPFKTGVDGAFHTGVCSAETQTGSAQIRLTATYENMSATTGYEKHMVILPNSAPLGSYKTNVYFTAIVDGCIVLKFDSNIGDTVSGAFSYQRPYVNE